MIFTIFIAFGSLILELIHFIFSGVAFLIPNQIEQAIIYAMGYVNVFRGVFDVATLMECVALILTAWGAKYSIKIFFKFILPFIPFFNKHQIEPFDAIQQHRAFEKMKNTSGINSRSYQKKMIKRHWWSKRQYR